MSTPTKAAEIREAINNAIEGNNAEDPTTIYNELDRAIALLADMEMERETVALPLTDIA